MVESRTRIVVIGAGISGLAAAYFIHRGSDCAQVEVIVLEGSGRAGGVIATEVAAGAVIDKGPEAFLTAKPQVVDLVRELGLTHSVISTNEKHRRTFIARRSKLHPMPDGFVLFAPTKFRPWLTTGVVSVPCKIRMAMDLVIPRKGDAVDESLADFVQRRLGQEAFTQLAEPMIAGIYGGDARLLSSKCTVPQMVQYEAECGSIIRGLWKQKLQKKDGRNSAVAGSRYGLFASFDRGMQVLIDGLLRHLPAGSVCLNTPVDHIVHSTLPEYGYEICLCSGKRIGAHSVVVATPANIAGQLLCPINASLGHKLRQIAYAPTVIVNLLFYRKDIRHALDGFGFVVPPKEGRFTSACTFTSIKFGGRTEEDKVLLRVSLSREGQSLLDGASNQDVVAALLKDLEDYVGVERPPLQVWVTRHDNALPQYEVGHLERMQDLHAELGGCDDLYLAGNAYSGIGIPDCLASARRAADAVLNKLRIRRRDDFQQPTSEQLSYTPLG